jgi:hypothetical protein
LTPAFGDTRTELELQPSGAYKPVERFSEFINVPELIDMFRSVADVVQKDDLRQYLKLPKIRGGQRQLITAPASQAFRDYQKVLADRIKKIETWSRRVVKGDDIFLSVITDGRHILAGNRRVAQAVRAELSDIDVLVAASDETHDLMRSVSENLIRASMNSVDIWRAIDAPREAKLDRAGDSRRACPAGAHSLAAQAPRSSSPAHVGGDGRRQHAERRSAAHHRVSISRRTGASLEKMPAEERPRCRLVQARPCPCKAAHAL